jgi:uroporphyrinogen-III synthase
MGGRIALAENDAVIPKSLKFAVIGPKTAREINLID